MLCNIIANKEGDEKMALGYNGRTLRNKPQVIKELNAMGITELYLKGGKVRDLERCPNNHLYAAYYDHKHRRRR